MFNFWSVFRLFSSLLVFEQKYCNSKAVKAVSLKIFLFIGILYKTLLLYDSYYVTSSSSHIPYIINNSTYSFSPVFSVGTYSFKCFNVFKTFGFWFESLSRFRYLPWLYQAIFLGCSAGFFVGFTNACNIKRANVCDGKRMRCPSQGNLRLKMTVLHGIVLVRWYRSSLNIILVY